MQLGARKEIMRANPVRLFALLLVAIYCPAQNAPPSPGAMMLHKRAKSCIRLSNLTLGTPRKWPQR